MCTNSPTSCGSSTSRWSRCWTSQSPRWGTPSTSSCCCFTRESTVGCGWLETCPECKFSSFSVLFFSAQVCCTTPVMDTRTTATVSWFLWMHRTLTARQTVYVCRASLNWCRRRRRASTCFCLTCAGRGDSTLKLTVSYISCQSGQNLRSGLVSHQQYYYTPAVMCCGFFNFQIQ